jgi:hypothetical protein
MENLLLTICFFLSLFGTFYFLGRLLTWVVFKIAPGNCKTGFSGIKILYTNSVGVLSCIGWTILFYFVVLKK